MFSETVDISMLEDSQALFTNSPPTTTNVLDFNVAASDFEKEFSNLVLSSSFCFMTGLLVVRLTEGLEVWKKKKKYQKVVQTLFGESCCFTFLHCEEEKKKPLKNTNKGI